MFEEDVFEEDVFEEDDVVFEEDALSQGSHTMRWSTWQFRDGEPNDVSSRSTHERTWQTTMSNSLVSSVSPFVAFALGTLTILLQPFQVAGEG